MDPDFTVSDIELIDDSIFIAGLDDVTSMNKILHELHHADDHSVLVITQNGLRLITAGEKTFQVSAYFAASTFQKYRFNLEEHHQVNFRFMLKDFIECLNLLRDDPIVDGDRMQNLADAEQSSDMMKTSLLIRYRKRGDPLRLRLENNSNYVISCDLKAFNLPSDTMFRPLAFLDSEDTAVIVLNSKRLYEYVSGLDLFSSEYVYLSMSRGEVPLRMCTQSTQLGEVELEITENEKEIIVNDILVSENCHFNFTYKAQFMRPALEALRTSSLMQMRCGTSGLLCIEHFHGTDRQQNKRSSVEYFILSEVNSPSDDDYNIKMINI